MNFKCKNCGLEHYLRHSEEKFTGPMRKGDLGFCGRCGQFHVLEPDGTFTMVTDEFVISAMPPFAADCAIGIAVRIRETWAVHYKSGTVTFYAQQKQPHGNWLTIGEGVSAAEAVHDPAINDAIKKTIRQCVDGGCFEIRVIRSDSNEVVLQCPVTFSAIDKLLP